MTVAAERALVRDLATRVAEIAAEPRMAAIKQRWRDVNALRRPDRAPVWCRPVGCWKEILPPDAFVCTDPWLRRFEEHFRRILHKRELDDDTPVDEWYAVGALWQHVPANLWGVDVRHRPSGAAGGAWAYDPPLRTAEDFDRLVLPRWHLDTVATDRESARTAELLDGIMPVRRTCGPLLGATLGTAAADLRGLTQIMMDMAVDPDLMHRLMAYLRDATLAALDAVEDSGLLTPNNLGPMTESDPIGDPADPPTLANLWCMANSQEFDQVSPAMWEEFCLAYQRPIFARFGRVGYGCCENLTRKVDGVLSIPNLRIFVCSAWTDLTTVLDKVGTDYCIMWRQKASDVVFPDDEATIRRDLEDGARRLQERSYQIVLRELETLSGHPRRLHDWTRFATAAAEHYA